MSGTVAIDGILAEAVEIAIPEDRLAFIALACAGDDALRSRVEKLVASYLRAGNFLEEPAAILPAQTALTSSVGAKIGPYKLLEQIGEGGMGLVYVAEQSQPVRRTVALKVIKPGMDSKQVIARFEAERQALALMDHPHIAKVFDGGVTGEDSAGVGAGRPYFVMELIHGIPITEYCDQAKFSIRQRLDLFIKVCRAVQHAHTKGVIHRDLKPTNILVTSNDGDPVPKIIDFGVAKSLAQQLTERTLHTGFAQMIGTPMYMSPEQSEFNQLGVDTRSDIYSLGVLLYELLTGATPFDSDRLKKADFDELRKILREEEPLRPSARLSTIGNECLSTSTSRRQVDSRSLFQALRGELDWIVLKSLDKDRNRRYETASALARDVEHYLHNESVEACPPSVMYRLRKFAQRNRVVLTISSLASAMLAIVTLTILVSAWSLRKHNAELLAAVSRAEASELQSRRENYAGQIRFADEQLESGQIPLLRENLLSQVPRSGEEDLRGFEWNYLHAAAQRKLLRLPTKTNHWMEVKYSKDGRVLMTFGRDMVLRTWDAMTGKLLEAIDLPIDSPYLANTQFTEDGAKLLCMGTVPNDAESTYEFSLWDASARQCEFRHVALERADYQVICLSPDGNCIAYFRRQKERVPWGEMRLWNAALNSDRRIASEQPRIVHCAAFSPTGEFLAIAYRDNSSGDAPSSVIEVWDLKNSQRMSMSPKISGMILKIGYASDGQTIAAATYNNGPATVVLVDASNGAIRHRLGEFQFARASFAFSPNSQLLAIGNNLEPHSEISIWDARQGVRLPLSEPLIPNSPVASLCFSPDNGSLAIGGEDGTAYMRKLQVGPQHVDLPGHDGQEAWSVAFTDEGQTLAVGYDDEVGANLASLKLWNVETAKEKTNLGGHDAMVSDVRSISRNFFASAGYDRKVILWRLEQNDPFQTLTGHSLPIKCLASSADGRFLASAGFDKAIRVWDLQEGKVSQLLDGLQAEVHRLALAPDGTNLASADDSGAIRIWNLESGKEIGFIRENYVVFGLCFAPDGKTLVSGNREGFVNIYDSSKWQNTKRLLGHRGEVRSVTSSPDGKTMATGGEDRSVRLWQASTGKELLVFRDLPARVNSVVFSSNGARLAAAMHNGTVRVWFGPVVKR